MVLKRSVCFAFRLGVLQRDRLLRRTCDVAVHAFGATLSTQFGAASTFIDCQSR
jgi:hypothetical protein